MKIVIFAGGTGSIALQTGLFDLLDKRIDGVDIKVITNAYDNGLSTGAVRRVCDGRILGPSDVRKNQTTRLKLEKPNSPWNAFLDIRFTCESAKVQQYCMGEIDRLEHNLQAYQDLRDESSLTTTKHPQRLLREAVEVFFSSPFSTKIDYNDFSLANIIYAGFAKANGNSLRTAAKIMAGLVGIADNVLVNDDTSLFLGAVTKSGKRITDEGDIVSWGNTEDPFVDIFFTTEKGKQTQPVLCDEARVALERADLIIMSSGTQWSSLIPTYASVGFKQAIEKSLAKIIMVMNRQPDKDSPGQSASDIVKIIVPRYFPNNRVHVLVDEDAHEIMNHVDEEATRLLASVTEMPLSPTNLTAAQRQSRLIAPMPKMPLSPTNLAAAQKHDPASLALAIGKVYFGDYLSSEHFMFDYDDTLVGRGNSLPKSSQFNKTVIGLLNNTSSISICTGNSIKAINLQSLAPLLVYADGGVNKYSYSSHSDSNEDDGVQHTLVGQVVDGVAFPSTGPLSVTGLIEKFVSAGIAYSKIENRGNVMLAIKPVDEEYRSAIINLLNYITDGSNLTVKPAGRTTVEISRPGVNKVGAVRDVLVSGVSSITYVGDELQSGNDNPVLLMNSKDVKCLSVKDPSETAFFLSMLLSALPVSTKLNHV